MITIAAECGAVAPALRKYSEGVLSDLWRRPALSPRDRGVATIASLIARNQTADMPYYFALALDCGLAPRELSEIVTHLAFYAGWPMVTGAAGILSPLFAERRIGASALPAAAPELLPLDAPSEAARAASVQENIGPVSQVLVDLTGEILFHDLWLRPDLKPRDRSLVTVSALIALGQVAQISFHLNKAMDGGLTKAQVAELLAHLAFYAGWPPVMSAVPVVREVLKSRGA